MVAAIYARKSTQQNGVIDEQRSVVRQVEEARAFASRNGWTVLHEHVYVDDGISGAEFANRPGFLRLMNALKPRAPFQVLIMSEESRLGREQLEVGFALKQLVTSGVRVFSYLTGAERTLDSAMDKAMFALQTMADEMEREKARQRTYDAMKSKARAGHVTGGRCFGYRNVDVIGADGRRVYVEQEIDEAEALVVQRIFRLAAEGHGLTGIAKTLNGEGTRPPRAQQGRPNGWCASSVRAVLHRSRYRGVLQWGKTKKRDKWGQAKRQEQPASAHLVVDAPHLRIVSDELWQAAHARMDANRTRYARKRVQRRGRPPGSGAKHLLAGVLRCAVCGAGMEARSRNHGKERVYFYGCSAFHRKGSRVCSNNLTVPMRAADAAVLEALKDQLLGASVIDEALRRAARQLIAPRTEEATLLQDRLSVLDAEMTNLTKALAEGGNMTALLDALKTRELERKNLSERLKALHAPTVIDLDEIRKHLQRSVQDWRRTLIEHPNEARLMLQQLVEGRLEMQPREDGDERYYEFSGVGTVLPLVGGAVSHNLASPTGTAASWIVVDGVSDYLRAA